MAEVANMNLQFLGQRLDSTNSHALIT